MEVGKVEFNNSPVGAKSIAEMSETELRAAIEFLRGRREQFRAEAIKKRKEAEEAAVTVIPKAPRAPRAKRSTNPSIAALLMGDDDEKEEEKPGTR